MDIFAIMNKYGVKIPAEKSAEFKRDFKSAYCEKTEYDSALSAAQTKFDDELSKAKEEFSAKEYSLVCERMLDKTEFSCPLAREAVGEKLKAAALPLENGVLAGGEAFIKALRSENPALFSSEPLSISISGITSGSSSGLVAKAGLRSAFGLPV